MIKKIYRKTLAFITLFSIELITIWVLFFASLFLFGYVVNELLLNHQEEFDNKAYYWVREFSSPWLTKVMLFVTFLGSREFIPVLFCIVLGYFIFIKKHRWYSLKIPVVAIGSILLNLFLKFLFNRPRPEINRLVEVTGLSFPSGHAMTSFSFYGLLIYFAWKEINNIYLKYALCIFLLILIHFIGISRIYLGVHYASDVIAGFAIGYTWLILSIFILKKIETGYRKKIDPSRTLEL